MTCVRACFALMIIYIYTAIPNMHQVTYFNLVQLKKNETIQWLQQLQQSQQNEIIILAVANSRKTMASHRKDDAKICRQKRII